MDLCLFRLHFSGPVRFGVTGIGLEETDLTLAADGLTSAFLNALSEALGAAAVAAFLSECQANRPPAIFSNLFPFGPAPENPSKSIEVLPRPLCAPPCTEEALRLFGKELKKLAWLRPHDTAAWLQTDPLPQDKLTKLVTASQGLVQQKENMDDNGWYKEELRPRVALDRQDQGSSLWACAAVRFASRAGLYGLVRLREDFRPAWLQAMRLLGDMGLGGERTYGYGEFQLEGPFPLGADWEPMLKLPAGRYLLLSTYFPSTSERENLARALEAWDIEERRGYVVSGRHTTTLKRKRVRFLKAGSIFQQPLQGALADVTPEEHLALGLTHRVYRAGFALTLPLY
jgi:CRISPR-associated protein Csm4